MASILITDKISADAVEKLRQKHKVEEFTEWAEQSEVNKKIKGFDALVIRSRTKADKALIDSADRLKVIARAGAGLDNVDKKHAEAKGIKVLNTPTANLLSAAELTVGLAFSLMRQIPRADNGIRNGRWEKKELKGVEITGKTWGIVGFGHVGQLVNGLIKGFKCKVIAYDPFIPAEVAAAANVKLCPLDEVVKEADIISIHVPLLDATRGLIGAKQIALMKKNAILINTSRGGIVNEKALYEALKDKKIAGAALDVFEKEPPVGSPLLSLENTVFTCHIGAQTSDAQKRVGEEIVRVLLEALK